MNRLAQDLDIVAQHLNGYFAARLGPCAPLDRVAGDGPKLVEAVLDVQRNAPDLLADGVLGPKTRAYLSGTKASPTSHTGYLIINGKAVPTPFATVTFDKPEGLSFIGQPHWQPRDEPSGKNIDLCVLHWDECISSTHCFGVLLRRGLSVHLMLDADGMVYQALDLAIARAWHARTHNERSIGIEIQNALLPYGPQRRHHDRAWVEENLPHTDELFGHTDFTQAQKQTIVPLVQWLCDNLHIPRELPTDESEKVYTSLCPQPFRGVCGHYHLQTDKVDPGARLWPLLAPAMLSAPHIV